MKNYIATTIAATGLIVFIFGMGCSAQSVRRLTANIPFDFYVGEEKMPSGRYEFETTMRQTTAGGLIVRPVVKPARKSVLVPAFGQPSKATDEPILTFNQYGSVHFLSRVNLVADEVMFRIRKTATEERVAKELHLMAVPVTVRQAVAAKR
ncbi:MAG TPA: hypothetical protein VJV05_04910 [Pyrinomonadaceae bacterium]|nr:hypothetical protein [Pyrinomonadaceae bacterium]